MWLSSIFGSYPFQAASLVEAMSTDRLRAA